jgi:acetyl esterase/lipase
MEVCMRRSRVFGHAVVSLGCVLAVFATGAQAQTVGVNTDVEYGKPGGVSLKLDVYRPVGAGRLPAVLVIHGGGWRSGSKESWASVGRRLAREGFVAFVLAYRLACRAPANPLCGFHHPAAVNDVRRAFRWVRAHGPAYGADRKRIGALGGSAGGHLAMLIGTTKKGGTGPLRAVVAWSGLSLMLGLVPGGPVQNYLGCAPDACPGKYADASPLLHVTPDDAPAYLAHSRQEQVPLFQSSAMAEKLTAAGVPNELRVLEGTRHSRAFEDDVWDESVRFLHGYLG